MKFDGFTLREDIGIGDKIQFTSLPENFFRATGRKLIDVSKSWVFDHNPYVDRESNAQNPIELWNFPKIWEWPVPRPGQTVYQSNAEIWAAHFGVPVVLNRPRLYFSEQPLPYEKRELILLHTQGRSHGEMPEKVIRWVIEKYAPTQRLFQVGLPGGADLGIPHLSTPTAWDLANVISECRLFIGVDSGPSWIAACYPEVMVKKIRLRAVHGEKELKDWIPLEISNFHSHWDDRLFQVYNASEEDVGFTQSYLKL
jgi:hypothetical protein